LPGAGVPDRLTVDEIAGEILGLLPGPEPAARRLADG
jgi:hypothetical protein